MILAIIGSRTIKETKENKNLIKIAIQKAFGWSNITGISTGCAKGADSLALDIWLDSKHANLQLEFHYFPAKWGEGKKAGPDRNIKVEHSADAVFAVVDKELHFSKGTNNCVNLFKQNNKPVFVYNIVKNKLKCLQEASGRWNE